MVNPLSESLWEERGVVRKTREKVCCISIYYRNVFQPSCGTAPRFGCSHCQLAFSIDPGPVDSGESGVKNGGAARRGILGEWLL